MGSSLPPASDEVSHEAECNDSHSLPYFFLLLLFFDMHIRKILPFHLEIKDAEIVRNGFSRMIELVLLMLLFIAGCFLGKSSSEILYQIHYFVIYLEKVLFEQ